MKSIEDLPIDLLKTISHTTKILDWHENLMEKDVPPEWMWPFDKELEKHFEKVKEEMANPTSEATDDRTQVPLMTNELAHDRR